VQKEKENKGVFPKSQSNAAEWGATKKYPHQAKEKSSSSSGTSDHVHGESFAPSGEEEDRRRKREESGGMALRIGGVKKSFIGKGSPEPPKERNRKKEPAYTKRGLERIRASPSFFNELKGKRGRAC